MNIIAKLISQTENFHTGNKALLKVQFKSENMKNW